MLLQLYPFLCYTLALLSALCIVPVSAIYEDEAGVTDWHRSQLGLLTDSPAPGIYYSQFTNSLAKINNTDGSIIWRHILSTNPSDISPTFHYIPKTNYLVVGTSSDGSNSCKISLFDTSSSSKQWELTVSGKCIGFTSSPNIYALTSSALYSIDLESGVLITKPLRPELLHSPFEFVAISTNGVVLGDSAAGSILEYEFTKNSDSSDGSESQIVDPFGTAPIVLGPGEFIDYNFGNLVWAEQSAKESTKTVRVGAFELFTSKGELPSIKVISSSVIAALYNNVLSVYSVTKAGTKLAYKLENVASFSTVDSYSFVILKTDNTISIINAKAGSSNFSRHAFTTPSLISRNFVQYSNGLVEPVNFSKSSNVTNSVSWTRDESLAHLAGSALIDFPDSTHLSLDLNEAIHEESTDVITAYSGRVIRHSKDIFSFLTSGFFRPSRLFRFVASFFKAPSDLAQQEASIYFGLKKYFVAVSKTGRVQALDSSSNGKSVWSHDIFPASKEFYNLLVTSIDNKIFIINADTGDVVEIDGLTGETISTSQIPVTGKNEIFKIVDLYFPRSNKTIEELESVDVTDEKIKTPVVWTTSDQLYQLDGARFIPQNDIFVSRISESKDSVLGFKVFGKSSEKPGFLKNIWEHNAPNGHKIHTVTSRSPLDATVNVGHVLGDRSVLYKYLHPNMIAVLSSAPGSIHVSLVDSITGRILHSEFHQTGLDHAVNIDLDQIDKSSHIVVGESWVVYTFWSSQPTLGQIIVVWDLFESSEPNVHWMTEESRKLLKGDDNNEDGEIKLDEEESEEKDVKVEKKFKTAHSRRSIKSDKKDAKKPKKTVLKSKPAPSHYSSFENYDSPNVKSQAYYVPTQYSRITSMGISRTRFGVSVRDILVSTSRGQVFALPKRPGYLDARRPVGRALTNDEKAEGLTEYSGVLPYTPDQFTLSHKFLVAGIDHIDTVPSVLESTSVVVAHGLDVFATKVMPSRQFDVLSPSFAKDKLAYTILGMLGVVLYLKPMVDRKKTDHLWK